MTRAGRIIATVVLALVVVLVVVIATSTTRDAPVTDSLEWLLGHNPAGVGSFFIALGATVQTILYLVAGKHPEPGQPGRAAALMTTASWALIALGSWYVFIGTYWPPPW
ncbi:hypothetical protein [Nocardioides sp. GXZ039]|uniref:hypothetical protein n=1 Tax=Nocardioides sp. GXZ039 TaxID=3136018 RepID=UPI0030F423B7